jgi:hypothetical protein
VYDAPSVPGPQPCRTSLLRDKFSTVC